LSSTKTSAFIGDPFLILQCTHGNKILIPFRILKELQNQKSKQLSCNGDVLWMLKVPKGTIEAKK